MPTWLLSRPARFTYLLIGVASVFVLLVHRHDAKVRRDAINESRTAANDSMQQQNQVVRDSAAAVVAATRDTLQEVRLRADVVRRSAGTASVNYDAQRRLVNTSAPQPAGVPAGSVIVPIAFVQAADSAIRLLPVLLAQAALERAASQQQINALLLQHTADTVAIRLRDEQNALLRIAIETARPGISGRLKWAVVGGAVVAAGGFLLQRGQ